MQETKVEIESSTKQVDAKLNNNFSIDLSPVYEKVKFNEANRETVNVIEGIDEDDEEEVSKSVEIKEQSNLSSTCASSESSLVETNKSQRIADLVQPAEHYKDKSDYFRNVVVAIDQLYPSLKWPLYNTWTFWYIKHDNSIKNWSDRIKQVMDISYIEDFWSAINYLLYLPGLTSQGDLTFFKKGVRPEWEDDENRMGGCWLYQMSAQHQVKKIDDLWLDTLLGLIGDNFCEPQLIKQLDSNYNLKNESEHICDYISGTILMHRGKNEKVALWTKNYKDDHTTRLIGSVTACALNQLNFMALNLCFFFFKRLGKLGNICLNSAKM